MIKPDKTCCDKNLQHGMKRGDESEWMKVNCRNGGTAEEIWKSIRFLLQQFIRCEADGVLNPEDMYNDKCDRCSFEREEIMNNIWHYGNSLLKENSKSTDL